MTKITHENRQLIISMIEANGHIYWDFDPITSELFISPLMKTLLGYQQDEIDIDLTEWSKLVHPDDFAKASAIFGRMLEGEFDRYESEIRVKRKDGSYIWLMDRGHVQERNDEGEVTLVCGSHVDISSEKHRQQALIQEQKISSTIVNTANAIIAQIDFNGVMFDINKYGEAFTGYSKAEIVSEPYFWSRFLNEEVRGKVGSIVDKAKQGEIVKSYRNTWLHHSGQERMIEWSNAVLSDADGSIGIFTIGIDIEEQYQLEQKIQKYNWALTEAQKIARLGFWRLDSLTDELVWSDEIYDLFEVSRDEVSPTLEVFTQFIHPEDREAVHKEFEGSIDEKREYHIIHRAITKNGHELILEEKCKHEFDDNGRLLYSLGTVLDITEKAKQEKRLQNIFDMQSNMAVILREEPDAKTTVVMANEALLAFLGAKSADELNETYQCICETFIEEKGYFSKAMTDGCKNWVHQIRDLDESERKVKVLSATGIEHVFLINVTQLEGGECLVTFTDISETQLQSLASQQKAIHDALTGLYNRHFLEDTFAAIEAKCQKDNRILGFIVFDIDNFKAVNDTFGHDAGDLVLKGLAQITHDNFRESDFAIRWGGEEFLVLLSVRSLEDLVQEAERLRQAVEDNHFEEVERVTISLGVASHDFGESMDETFKRADVALYEAKNAGKNQVKTQV